MIKQLSLVCILSVVTFIFSCEKDNDNKDDSQGLCEICNSHCCDQIGTESCCCSPNF